MTKRCLSLLAAEEHLLEAGECKLYSMKMLG